MLRRAPALRHAGVVFIRKTATRARHDGGSYTSFRLVESVRSVGCERLALHALDQLGLQDALRAQGVSARDAAVAAALVVARMVHPSSEHAAHAWLAGSSATLELLGLERAKPLSLSKLYRTSDLLWKHREALETALAQRERSLFDTPEAIVFYDLTNVHYHGRPAGDMQFGRSKQKRSDCPLATLALALDGAGFPRCSEVLKGNVSEPGTLQAAIERLEAQQGAGPLPTVVMDAGLSTEANLDWLRARGYPWITVQRGRAPRPDSAPDAAFATRAGHPVQAWRVDSEGDETHLRVWSQQRQQKDEAIVARRRQRARSAAGHRDPDRAQRQASGARRPGLHVLAAQTPGAGGPALQLGDDPPPARRLGPPHHLPARGRRPLDPVPPGLPPRRQSRRTGPRHRPDAGPASHAHQPRGGCHAATVFHTIIGAPDRFCDAITPDLHP